MAPNAALMKRLQQAQDLLPELAQRHKELLTDHQQDLAYLTAMRTLPLAVVRAVKQAYALTQVRLSTTH